MHASIPPNTPVTGDLVNLPENIARGCRQTCAERVSLPRCMGQSGVIFPLTRRDGCTTMVSLYGSLLQRDRAVRSRSTAGTY